MITCSNPLHALFITLGALSAAIETANGPQHIVAAAEPFDKRN